MAWGRHLTFSFRAACFGRALRLLITLLVATTALPGCGAESASHSAQSNQATQAVQIDGKTFELELALTPEARYNGLSGRDHIDARGGMLFVFPSPRKTHFVMRDCRVPIDLLFLDAQGRVIRMHQMPVEQGPPWTRYPSYYPTQFAIELKGGLLDTLDIAKTDRIDLPLKALKARAR
jgi:uncharacterized membrane protein (UPF0127 family)